MCYKCVTYGNFRRFDLFFFVPVLYAADLGPSGLDTEILVTREDVESVVRDEDDCEYGYPFIPEWSSYRVCSIYRGKILRGWKSRFVNTIVPVIFR